MDELQAVLPALYQRWLDAALGGPIPAETEATCDDCAMCASPGEHMRGELFDRETKCCTYLPALPNFLVGAILADEDPHPAAVHGRRTVEERIARGVGVSPLGLERPRVHQVLYRLSDGFGRARTLRCPHFLPESGQCGVWKHRMSMCATWHCKYVRGAVGEHFWKSVHRLLSTLERELAVACVRELELGADALEKLFPVHTGTAPDPLLTRADLDGKEDAEALRARWGSWAGRERELYLTSWARVAELSFTEVLARVGPEAFVAIDLLEQSYANLRSRALPEALVLGPFQLIAADAERVRVSSYNSYDPLEIPRELFDVLPRFDGRRVSDVLETIATGDGVEIEEDSVRKLVDFRILVAAD